MVSVTHRRNRKERVCRYCTEPFVPGLRHPGLIDVCLEFDCQQAARQNGIADPILKTACVAWSGKHTVEITIVDDPAKAAYFNAAQRRHGAGVQRCHTGPVYATPFAREAGVDYGFPAEDDESDRKPNEPGSIYRSRLGEYYAIKR